MPSILTMTTTDFTVGVGQKIASGLGQTTVSNVVNVLEYD